MNKLGQVLSYLLDLFLVCYATYMIFDPNPTTKDVLFLVVMTMFRTMNIENKVEALADKVLGNDSNNPT